MKHFLRYALLLALGISTASAPAAAQERPNFDPTRPGITRAELAALKALLDSAAQSTAYSAALRIEARSLASRAQARLEEGDFRVGDHVYVNVQVPDRPELVDTTFVIGAGVVLPLPVVGPLPLKGVLHGELQSRLKAHVDRVIRLDPPVQATPMVRIEVSGDVRLPGFYNVNIDAPLTDALMEAGPNPTASLVNLRIERGTTPILGGNALQNDIANGKTIAQLGLRAGDRLFVPVTQNRSAGELLRLVIVALPSLAFLLTTL